MTREQINVEGTVLSEDMLKFTHEAEYFLYGLKFGEKRHF